MPQILSPGTRRAILVVGLVVLAMLVAPVAAGASGDASPAPAAPASSGAASPAAAPAADPTAPAYTITCVLSPAAILCGDSVTVSGAVTPAAEGLDVAVSVDGVDAATVTTDAAGAFSLVLKPLRNATIAARLVSDGTASASQDLIVRPRIDVTTATPIPFLSLKSVVHVTPAAYDGVVTVRVVHRGKLVATLKARCQGGQATFAVPLRGIDWFTVTYVLPPVADLGSRTVDTHVKAVPKRLSVGSSGLRVKGLLQALNRLHIRVPGIGTSFTGKVKDAVVAFQKAYRLPRTYVMSGDDWSKLDVATIVKPRHAAPSLHLEVDKGRQILMVVKGGKVLGLIAVSTGATGNTPEGSFRIQQKHPYTTSGYGGLLFRTMGFVGDFAIHGYVPVPPYPASHGCIREPMWAANWVYVHSYVGERLYIYH